MTVYLPIGSLKNPALGCSRYQDATPVPTSPLADDIGVSHSLVPNTQEWQGVDTQRELTPDTRHTNKVTLVSSIITCFQRAGRSSVVERSFKVRLVVESIPSVGSIELVRIPTNAPQLV